jgi:hypothetical protein
MSAGNIDLIFASSCGFFETFVVRALGSVVVTIVPVPVVVEVEFETDVEPVEVEEVDVNVFLVEAEFGVFVWVVPLFAGLLDADVVVFPLEPWVVLTGEVVLDGF